MSSVSRNGEKGALEPAERESTLELGVHPQSDEGDPRVVIFGASVTAERTRGAASGLRPRAQS